MHRRRFLALVGCAAAAGCSAPGAGVGTEPPTLTPVDVPATESPTPGSSAPIQSRGRFGEASVVNLRTGPRTLALSPVEYRRDDLEVDLEFESSATITQPATLEARLTNRGSTAIQVDTGTLPPFDTGLSLVEPAAGSRPETPSARLLVPVGGAFGAENPGTERGPEGYWRASTPPPSLSGVLEFEPGQRRRGTFVLLGAPGAVGFPKGRYGSATGPFSLAVWDTGSPGPREPSRFDDVTVPALPNTDGTNWFHEAVPQTGIFLDPQVERAAVPTAFRFTLVNHTIDPLGGNPDEWKLHKLVDGAWYRVAPWTIDLSAGPIPPGGQFDYVIAASHGPRPPCDCAATGGAVGYLGGGTYALEAGYSRVRTSETYAALFRLMARDRSVEPTGAATVEREASRTVVTRPEWGDGEEPPDATMTVAHTSDSSARRIIAEQVYRPPFQALRDVLPYRSETPVVLRADARVVGSFLGGDVRRSFRYDGETYVAMAGEEATATVSE